jgi:hypothetical protein
MLMVVITRLVEIEIVEHSIEKSSYFSSTRRLSNLRIEIRFIVFRLLWWSSEEFKHIRDGPIQSTRPMLFLFTPTRTIAIERIKGICTLNSFANLLARVVGIRPAHDR